MRAMPLQLVLREQDVKELLIGLLMGRLHPLLQLIDVQIVLFSLEGGLERHVQDPVLFIAAASDEIDGFARLQDLIRQVVREEGWNHDVVELVLLGPQFVITDIRVRLHEELLERIVDFTGNHPCLNHGEDRRGYLLQDPADEVLCAWAAVEHVGVDG